MGRQEKGNYKKKKREQNGLRIDVKNNNIEFALKKLKRMVKDSGQILEMKNRSYYQKPSAVKREKKSSQAARYRYQDKKENNSY